MLNRRSVLTLGVASVLSAPVSAQDALGFGVRPAPNDGQVQPIEVKFIEGFEPSSDVWTVEREVGLALDYSSSMDVSEVAQSISGAIDGITRSRLLNAEKDSFCQGPVGLMVSVFRTIAVQYGYMVIRSPEQASLAKQKLMEDLSVQATADSTGVGEGLNMLNGMFQGSPFAGRPVTARMAFLIGDGQNNTGHDPIQASHALARDCGVTTHCIEMLKDVYIGIPTPGNIIYQDGNIPVPVAAGERRFANRAEDITSFMHEKIDPNCVNMARLNRPPLSRRGLILGQG